MDIELSAPQGEFFESNAPSVAVVAGYGSGKSEVSMFRMTTTMFQFPGANMLYMAPTFPLVKDVFYPKIESYFEELKVRYHINRAENTITVKNYGKIFCRTFEHPHRIIGFEAVDAFLDEFDVLTTDKALDVWRKVKARCRQQVGKVNQVYIATTPEGFRGTYELFKENPLPGSHLIQMSTYSNEHNLSPDYIEELKANYPAQLIDAYINGEFVNLVNLPVWGDYDRDKNNSDEEVKRNEEIKVGIDFNVGRGCAVVYVDRGSGLHAVDEIVDSYDTNDTIRVLNERYPGNRVDCYPDASGKSRKSVNATISDIALLKDEGFKVHANKKNPNIKDRVMATNAQFCNALGNRKLYVNRHACPNLSAALMKQVYDDNGLPEKGANKFDDLTDAASYPIAYLKPIKKRTTGVVDTVGT